MCAGGPAPADRQSLGAFQFFRLVLGYFLLQEEVCTGVVVLHDADEHLLAARDDPDHLPALQTMIGQRGHFKTLARRIFVQYLACRQVDHLVQENPFALLQTLAGDRAPLVTLPPFLSLKLIALVHDLRRLEDLPGYLADLPVLASLRAEQ